MRIFTKLGEFSVRFRWLVIIAWIAAVPILASTLPNISDVSQNNNSDFLPKKNASAEAIKLEEVFQGKDTAGNVYVVAARDSGLTAVDKAALARVATQIKKIDAVTAVQDRGVSADGQAEQLSVSFGSKANGPNGVTYLDTLRNLVHKDLPSGLQVHLAGEIAEEIDADNKNKNGKDNTQLFTVVFILVLLLFVFRSVLAPLVTLLPAALALAIAQPIIAEATKAGVKVSFITEILLVVLILGAGTDYGLFLVFRVREELRNGLQPKAAVVKALSRVGESITFSALTVAAALLSLMLASFGIYRGLGPALAIGLAVMLLAALTFLPALLSVLGRAVFWPSKTAKTPLKIGMWGRLADRVIERPVLMIVIGFVVFAGLGLGIHGYKTNGFGGSSAPAGTDSAAGRLLLQKHFPELSNNPQLAIFKVSDNVWQHPEVMQTAQASLQHSGQYKSVAGPFAISGYTLSPEQITAAHQATENPLNQALAQFISPDGHTFQFFVVSKVGKPGSTEAIEHTPVLRQSLAAASRSVHAQHSGFYGTDAVAYDISHIANNDLKRIIPVVLIIIALLLAVLLRSLVAPWYLIITVALSYIATLGFAMLVFVHWGHSDGLNFILPFMLFVFSMALGEDYNILVMTRIREESESSALKPAVIKAVGVTGTTVTSAGLILAGTFGVLGLVGGAGQIQQIGFSIAFGILLDTFFVRTLLVPSIVALLGKWNWWPSKLYRTS